MRTPIAFAAASLLLALPVEAGGFDAERVPAGARAVVHVDVAGLQRTALWRMAGELGLHAELDELGELEREFGVNPLRDVRSVTIWDTTGTGEGKAAVLVTGARIDAALERLQGAPQYRSVESDRLRVHAWDDGDDMSVFAFVHPTGDDERVVILSDRTDILIEGIRVLFGQAPSLADTPAAAITARPSAGSLVFVALTQGLPGADWAHEASAVLGLAEQVVLDVGESREMLFAHASIWTKSLEDAQNLNDILEGLRALGRLALGRAEDVPPQLPEWLGNLRFGHRGNVVEVDFEIAVEELAQVAREAEAR